MPQKKNDTPEKKSFIMYASYADAMVHLSLEEKGMLLDAIFAYEFERETPELKSPQLAVMFAVVKSNLDRDRERYEEISRENSRKAKLRWEKASEHKHRGKRQQNAAACSGIFGNAEVCLNDNDNDNDNVNVNVNDNVNDNDNEGEKIPEAPSAQGCLKTQENLFEAFWNEYPSKSYPDRAELAWRRLIGEDRTRAEAVMRALRRAKREDFRFLGGHIPFASNWLQSDRPWEEGWAPPQSMSAQAPQRNTYSAPPRAAEYAEPQSQSGSSSFDTDEFFARALAKSYGEPPEKFQNLHY